MLRNMENWPIYSQRILLALVDKASPEEAYGLVQPRTMEVGKAGSLQGLLLQDGRSPSTSRLRRSGLVSIPYHRNMLT